MYRFIGIGVLTQEIEPFKEILNFGQNFRASPPLILVCRRATRICKIVKCGRALSSFSVDLSLSIFV